MIILWILIGITVYFFTGVLIAAYVTNTARRLRDTAPLLWATMPNPAFVATAWPLLIIYTLIHILIIIVAFPFQKLYHSLTK